MASRKILIKLIEIYQREVSTRTVKRCRYYPTCSEYTRKAVEKYGAIKGTWMGCGRILRCNPFAKGGYDPMV